MMENRYSINCQRCSMKTYWVAVDSSVPRNCYHCGEKFNRMVAEVKLDIHPYDHTFTENIVCPYCKQGYTPSEVRLGSSDIDPEDEARCKNCLNHFKWKSSEIFHREEKEVWFTVYSTTKMKQ